MADSIRELLLTEIAARLALIRISGGYDTDIGLNVFRWKSTDFQDTEMPGVVVRDSETRFAPKVSADYHDWETEIDIIAVSMTDGDTGAELSKMASDIYRAIGTDWRFSGFIPGGHTTISPVSYSLEVKQASQGVIAQANYKWVLKHRNRAWDPFN